MVRQRETSTQHSPRLQLCFDALLKTFMMRLPFEDHRGTAVISHVQNSTRLYPDRDILDVFELKATALHTTAQSAHVSLYCVSTEKSDIIPARSGSAFSRLPCGISRSGHDPKTTQQGRRTVRV